MINRLTKNQRSGKVSYESLIKELEVLAESKKIGVTIFITNKPKFAYEANIVFYTGEKPMNRNGKNVIKAIPFYLSEVGVRSALRSAIGYLNDAH